MVLMGNWNNKGTQMRSVSPVLPEPSVIPVNSNDSLAGMTQQTVECGHVVVTTDCTYHVFLL